MDLSLIPTEDLVKELSKRFGLEVILCMDVVAARDYFELTNESNGTEHTLTGV